MKRGMTAAALGAILWIAAPGAPAGDFDREAAARLLNPDGAGAQAPAPAPDSGLTPEQREAARRVGGNVNRAEPELPDGCRLISYTRDGRSAKYNCAGYEILTVLLPPRDDVKAKNLADALAAGENCAAREPADTGYPVACETTEGTHLTYFADLSSGLTEMLIAPEAWGGHDGVAALENLSLAIYFYFRRVARDERQIEYLTGILKGAARIVPAENGPAQPPEKAAPGDGGPGSPAGAKSP